MAKQDILEFGNLTVCRDWLEACGIEQNKLGIQNPLIITSKGNLKRLKLQDIDAFKSIYSDTVPNPTIESCQGAVEFAAEGEYDGVIAIGGGSVMDTAKCVMASMSNKIYDMEELLFTKETYKTHIPSIFIPTTHGTGSEVTMWGTIWDFAEEKKYSISNPSLIPDAAIIDGNLALSLPIDISLSTVLDALSHSLESIWNKNKNSRATSYAVRAIGLIFDNIDALKNNPQDPQVRENLLIASYYAGIAMSETKTAAAHSISYPLTIHYQIPHGIAASITIPSLLRINESKIQDELSTIYHDRDITRLDELMDLFYRIPEGILKFRLCDWGIKREELKGLVKQCFTKGRMANNIVDLDELQVLSILEECY